MPRFCNVCVLQDCVPLSLQMEEFYDCMSAGGHAAWEEHARYKEVNEAFAHAMRDLLHPFYIQDVPINCYGKMNEDMHMPRPVDAYHAVGYPIPSPFLQNTLCWEQFTDALITLGKWEHEERD